MEANLVLCFVMHSISLSDTGGWGDNSGVSPVIQGVVENPGGEEAGGEAPTSGVAQLVGLGLLGQLPESGQVHGLENLDLIIINHFDLIKNLFRFHC